MHTGWGAPLGHGAQLGPLEPWHAEQFLAHIELSQEFLAPWTPWAATITDVERARTFLQRYADGHARDTDHLCGLWRDGALLGGAAFVNFNPAMGTCASGESQ